VFRVWQHVTKRGQPQMQKLVEELVPVAVQMQVPVTIPCCTISLRYTVPSCETRSPT